MPKARWLLHLQAQIWRFLMQIGMALHKLPGPKPPKVTFERVIPTTISPEQGLIPLQFYVPKRWHQRNEKGQEKFPVLINFHGGGFTLGSATDDARWAGAVNKQLDAIVVAVDYRLAPEYAFPTAVEDGVDAVLYVAKHAEELHIDVERIIVCGFSSGGNMAFTVPMRLDEELRKPFALDKAINTLGDVKRKSVDGVSVTEAPMELKIAAVVAWYPSCDYTITREQRKQTSVKKEKELSALFTELFDESYLAPEGIDLSSPYLSPAVAPKGMLDTLPQDIILYTCEWDMLKAEAERLKSRLERIGKTVTYHCIPKVPHGFDKAPNPLGIGGVKENYRAVCKRLGDILAAV